MLQKVVCGEEKYGVRWTSYLLKGPNNREHARLHKVVSSFQISYFFTWWEIHPRPMSPHSVVSKPSCGECPPRSRKIVTIRTVNCFHVKNNAVPRLKRAVIKC